MRETRLRVRESRASPLANRSKPWATPPRPERQKSNFDPSKVAKGRYESWFRTGLHNAQVDLAKTREGRPTKLFKSVCGLGAAVHHGFISNQIDP